jgi:citrate lyase subunit beta/citryl-CoA lyase
MTLDRISTLRSILFVPGARRDLFAKAEATGADALVLDLEDSVSTDMKGEARQHVADALARSAHRLTFVRINHPSSGLVDEDISVLAPHPSQALMVPKVDDAKDLLDVDRALTKFEQRAGLASGAIGIMIVVETCLGLRNMFEILQNMPRVRGAGLASAEEGDLMMDIGGYWTAAGDALAYARGKFVCDARAAKAEWLVDGAFMNLGSDDALEAEVSRARMLGFTGKIAIHPRQVPVINRAFMPSTDEIEKARRLLDAYREAEARGQGAIRFEGMMVDLANAKRAERILSFAAAAGVPASQQPDGSKDEKR